MMFPESIISIQQPQIGDHRIHSWPYLLSGGSELQTNPQILQLTPPSLPPCNSMVKWMWGSCSRDPRQQRERQSLSSHSTVSLSVSEFRKWSCRPSSSSDQNLRIILTPLFARHLTCQKRLLALLSKYVQNPTSSHHLHHFHAGPNHHHLSPGFLQETN